VRHTLGVLFLLDLDVGLDVAWAWEGIGLYVTRALVGTRLTWYGSGQSTGAAETKELLGRLLKADVNWMNEAYQMLAAGQAPPLRQLLARGIDAVGVRDVLLAYAFAAYLIEGQAGEVRAILLPVGKERVASASAVEAALGRSPEELDGRLARWLNERR
jgi:hypothetical protein